MEAGEVVVVVPEQRAWMRLNRVGAADGDHQRGEKVCGTIGQHREAMGTRQRCLVISHACKSVAPNVRRRNRGPGGSNIHLFWHVLQRIRAVHGEADQKDVGIGIRKGSQAIVILLPCVVMHPVAVSGPSDAPINTDCCCTSGGG